MQEIFSTPSVAVSLKKLEKGGYIEKAVDGTDNRYHKVVLTKKGSEIVKMSHEIFDQINEQLFSGFSLEELSVFTPPNIIIAAVTIITNPIIKT